jgi:hypothetical protein
MGRVRWDIVLLAALVVTLFWLRLSLADEIPGLTYDAYLTVRGIEHVHDTGLPLRHDPLSVTGSTRTGSPVFSYLMAGLLFFGEGVYKVVPNLLMALLLVPIYFLTLSLTRSRLASLIAAILAGTSPAVLSGYLATPAAAPLAILLLLIFLFLLQDPDKYLAWIVLLALLLTFLSPLIFVLALALLVGIIILRLEGFGVDRKVGELFFFTLMLAVWFHVLVYKKALFAQGARVLWQNLPAKYAALHFSVPGGLDFIYGLGVITFLFGILGMYHALFEQRERLSFSVTGSAIAVLLLLVTQAIELSLGLLLLSLLLAVMAGHGLCVTVEYIGRTKAPRSVYAFAALIFVLFLFTALLPALSDAQEALSSAPDAHEIASLQRLRDQLPAGTVMLTTVREGAAVQYYSNITTLTDDDFLLLAGGEELVRDIDAVYTARFGFTIVDKAGKLGFSHVLFSKDAARAYRRDRILTDDAFCVLREPVEGGAIVYRVLCLRGER